ncbi:MAG: GerMN domain-containing protein [Spirochaetales bacterium]|nr:GerMN domain-containing protein [Spirochaetales bacterium]MCF7939311.1 GerMN domain-containing protein [Spirochaetales bacterium]
MARKKTSLGCLFWVALALLIVVIFLFNRERINQVLESTGFVDIIRQEKTAEQEPEVIITDENGETQEQESEEREGETSEPTVIEIEPSDEKEQQPEKQTETKEKEDTQGAETAEKETAESTETSSSQEKPSDDAIEYRRGTIYFLLVTDEGHISLQPVKRNIAYEDAPLTQTLEVLLKGPDPQELNRNYLSLIPEGSRILGISVKNGVAYLNMNERFQFNTLGIEGYAAQLKQVVYTATEFKTVDSVQILIEGQKREYLGPEGIFIGAPLSREDLP